MAVWLSIDWSGVSWRVGYILAGVFVWLILFPVLDVPDRLRNWWRFRK